MSAQPSPSVLYQRTGGGDAYRVAMLEHGYVIPAAPWEQERLGKRVLQCGLVHDLNWSSWQVFEHDGRFYEGRWCRTCARTQARDIPAAAPAAKDER